MLLDQITEYVVAGSERGAVLLLDTNLVPAAAVGCDGASDDVAPALPGDGPPTTAAPAGAAPAAAADGAVAPTAAAAAAAATAEEQQLSEQLS